MNKFVDLQASRECSNHSVLQLLLHSFNSLFFQDNPGKPAPEKQKHSGRTNLDLLEQEIVSGSGISWAICKSAPHSRQITIQHPITQFFTGWMPFCRQTNSVKALKAQLMCRFVCRRI